MLLEMRMEDSVRGASEDKNEAEEKGAFALGGLSDEEGGGLRRGRERHTDSRN